MQVLAIGGSDTCEIGSAEFSLGWVLNELSELAREGRNVAVLARTSVGFTYDREPMMFCDPCGRLFKVPPMTLGELVRRWIVRKLLMWRLDNDTLREVPHRSNEGLALQARVSGPWSHKKESVLQVRLALWQGVQVQTVVDRV